GISTSTDPVKATIFAIESASENKDYIGILQIGLPNELRNFKLSPPNYYRYEKELEVIFNIRAEEFEKLSKVEISINDARKLVKEVFNIDLPASLRQETGESLRLLEELPASSLEKSFEFYEKAVKYSTK
ncbi:MAG TPA: hypothetical protein VIM65_12790, partial [Cyclobacteriaceae bacterium]